MRDKRPVDELSIEELERILAIRKREARQARLDRYAGRRVASPHVAPLGTPAPITASEENADNQPQFEGEEERPSTRPIIARRRPVSEPRPTVTEEDLMMESAPEPEDREPRFEDENRSRRAQPVKSRRVTLWNRALLGIEVMAVLGLAGLFVALFTSLQDITRTSSKIQQDFQATSAALLVPPTATPAINFAQIVLPGGHIYDPTTASGRFNLDEVPAQYRDAYQKLVLDIQPLNPPTPNAQGPLTIRIPSLGIEKPVVTGDSWEDLKRGVGQHIGSANPGEKGNMVLSAHNDVYGEIFKDLEKLQPGDKIYVATQSREYVYVMRSKEIVLPTEVRVLDNSNRSVSQITLITCYPYRVDTHRYVVYGELQPS